MGPPFDGRPPTAAGRVAADAADRDGTAGARGRGYLLVRDARFLEELASSEREADDDPGAGATAGSAAAPGWRGRRGRWGWGRRRGRIAAPDAARLREGLAAIEATAKKLARLIDELGDTARLEMGRALDLRPGPTDLVALARAVRRRVAAGDGPPTDPLRDGGGGVGRGQGCGAAGAGARQPPLERGQVQPGRGRDRGPGPARRGDGRAGGAGPGPRHPGGRPAAPLRALLPGEQRGGAGRGERARPGRGTGGR